MRDFSEFLACHELADDLGGDGPRLFGSAKSEIWTVQAFGS